MSYKRAGSAGALLERRSEWVAALKDSLPRFTDASAAPLQNGRRAAVLQQPSRRALDDAVRVSRLVLPGGWRDEANRRLARLLHGVVEPALVRQSDYFLCSLIHPTYISARTIGSGGEAARGRQQQQQVVLLRRSVAMPLELTVAGANTLRLVQSVHQFVATQPRLSPGRRSGGSAAAGSSHSLDAPWPELATVDRKAYLGALREAELESLILFDHAVFRPPGSTGAEAAEEVPPPEVALSAFTALCGSIELVGGLSSAIGFVDRVTRVRVGEDARVAEGARSTKGNL